ncbi:MAG: hypothetical protein IKL24_06890, partial [Clostridia bacterium]|nr:hypothetical protein [Clostridia bacterium]
MHEEMIENSVGDGALDIPPHKKQSLSKTCMHEEKPQDPVGDGALDIPPRTKQTPQVILTHIGKIVEKHLLFSENIPGVKINSY